MRYVQRNGNGEVVAHFSNPNAMAQEALADDHADLQAYRARRAAPPPFADQVAHGLRTNGAMRGLIRVLAKRFNVTPQQLLDAIKAETD